jgi:dihydroneopterin aldolase
VSVVEIFNYEIFVRDLQLEWQKEGHQEAVALTVKMNMEAPQTFSEDRYKLVTCYDRVVTGAKLRAVSGTFRSLEELCEDIGVHCLNDHRVESVSITLEPADSRNTGAGGCAGVYHRKGIGEPQ